MEPAAPSSDRLLRKMREDWNRRARENAFYHVASSNPSWSPEEFLKAGRESVLQLIVDDLERLRGRRSTSDMRVLEIGCGAARMTRAMAELFGEVHGVDVSDEMVARGRELLRDRPNAYLHVGGGADLAPVRGLRLDLAFSFIVFQHVPDRGIVESYVRETAALLRPGAWFKFQLQGRRVAERAPDDTWLGVDFTETQAREMVARAGLELLVVRGAGSQYFWVWARKPR